MNASDRRKQENDALLAKMKKGDNLCHTDLSAFRWAPRPIIKKDEREIRRLAGIEPGMVDALLSGPTKRGLSVVDGE